MGTKVKFFSNKLEKEIHGYVVSRSTYSVRIKLEDGNIIKKHINKVEFV